MSSQFQNRLVGTIVLVALGVIFLPDLLDGKKDKVQEEFAEIPLRPESRVVNAPEESFAVEELAPLDLGESREATGQADTSAGQDESLKQVQANEDKPQTVAAENASKPDSRSETKTEAKTEAKVDSKPPAGAAETKPAPKPVVKAEPKSETKSEPKAAQQAAWTLQLGAFSNAANVDALVKKLRKAGFKAYTLPAKPVDGSLTKVFVGPDVSQAKVERLKVEVKALTKLDGKVLSYNPLEQ